MCVLHFSVTSLSLDPDYIIRNQARDAVPSPNMRARARPASRSRSPTMHKAQSIAHNAQTNKPTSLIRAGSRLIARPGYTRRWRRSPEHADGDGRCSTCMAMGSPVFAAPAPASHKSPHRCLGVLIEVHCRLVRCFSAHSVASGWPTPLRGARKECESGRVRIRFRCGMR